MHAHCSAQFEACRESIVEQKGLVRDVCRVLYYKVGRYIAWRRGNRYFILEAGKRGVKGRETGRNKRGRQERKWGERS